MQMKGDETDMITECIWFTSVNCVYLKLLSRLFLKPLIGSKNTNNFSHFSAVQLQDLPIAANLNPNLECSTRICYSTTH
jgi:hypothetical protein